MTRIRTQHRPQGGFTLLELLVVFGIIALLMGVVPFAYSRWAQYLDFKNTLRDITFELRSAREQAMSLNAATSFTLNLRDRTFRAEGNKAKKLPVGVELLATTAAAASADNQTKSIVFYPDGGATGGTLQLTSETRSTAITIDWLTSKLAIESGKPGL